MTAREYVKTTHCRDLFHARIIQMRQAQSELVTAQLRMHTENMAIQTRLLERLATPHEADHLRKLMEIKTRISSSSRE